MKFNLRFFLKLAFITSQLVIMWLCVAHLYHSFLAKAIPILTGDQGVIQGITWKQIYYSSSVGRFYIIPVGYYTPGLVIFLSLTLSSMGWRFIKQFHKVALGVGVLILVHLTVLGYWIAIPSKAVMANLDMAILPSLLMQLLLLVVVPISLWCRLIPWKGNRGDRAL